MFGNVVRGVAGERFQELIAGAKRERGVKLDTELDGDALRGLTETISGLFFGFPTEPARAARATRSGRCSTRGWASAQFSTGGSTGCLMNGARRSTCSRWCMETRVRQSCSGVAFSPDEVAGPAEQLRETTSSMRRGRTSSPASGPRGRSE